MSAHYDREEGGGTGSAIAVHAANAGRVLLLCQLIGLLVGAAGAAAPPHHWLEAILHSSTYTNLMGLGGYVAVALAGRSGTRAGAAEGGEAPSGGPPRAALAAEFAATVLGVFAGALGANAISHVFWSEGLLWDGSGGWFYFNLATMAFFLAIGLAVATIRVHYNVRLFRERQRKATARARAGELAAAYAALERSHEELRLAQARLVQQEKLASLGALAAGVAHEIKNPLNFVNNFAALSHELLRDLMAAAEEDSELRVGDVADALSDLALNVGKIEEHGRRADGIVRSMLEHSRSTRGERGPTDLNALVEECVNVAYHAMRAQRPDWAPRVERSYDPATGCVELVPQEVGRAVVNLLSNAFYAACQPSLRQRDGHVPTVSVSTVRRDEGVEIRVRDNGLGVCEEVRDRVFEPFFTTKPVGEGTGLGLSLAYDIVVQGYGGALHMEGDEGEGATFVVLLPLRDGSALSAPLAARAPVEQHLVGIPGRPPSTAVSARPRR